MMEVAISLPSHLFWESIMHIWITQHWLNDVRALLFVRCESGVSGTWSARCCSQSLLLLWRNCDGSRRVKPKSYSGEGPGEVDFIIRGCTRRPSVDVLQFFVSAQICPLYNKPWNSSGICVRGICSLSGRSRINRTATRPWCPQLSVYVSGWE